MSLRVWKSRFPSPRNHCLRNPESGKLFLEVPKSEALESGIRLEGSRIPLTIGIWNPNSTDKVRNPESTANPESGIRNRQRIRNSWNPESTAWNPESNTVLDFLTWGEKWCVIYRIGSVKCDPPRRITLLARPTFYRFFVCLFFIFLM